MNKFLKITLGIFIVVGLLQVFLILFRPMLFVDILDKKEMYHQGDVLNFNYSNRNYSFFPNKIWKKEGLWFEEYIKNRNISIRNTSIKGSREVFPEDRMEIADSPSKMRLVFPFALLDNGIYSVKLISDSKDCKFFSWEISDSLYKREECIGSLRMHNGINEIIVSSYLGYERKIKINFSK